MKHYESSFVQFWQFIIVIILIFILAEASAMFFWLLLPTNHFNELYSVIFVASIMSFFSALIIWELIKKGKIIEDKLKKEETVNEGALNSLQDLFYVFNLKGRFLKWNKTVNIVTGYSDKEISTMIPSDFFSIEDAQLIADSIEKTVKNGEVSLEADLVSRNGEHMSYEFTGTLLKDDDGKPFGICGVGRNITERKYAEKALKESEEKYRTLINNIQDGVFIVQDANVHFANESFAKICGYSVKEVIGRDFLEFVAPDDQEIIANNFIRRQAGENVPREYELQFLRKNWEKVIVNMNVGLINYCGGAAIMGTVKDITERSKIEKELKESEEKYRTIIEISNDLIWKLDRSGNFLYFNKKAAEVSGYKLEMFIGKSFVPFIVPSDLPKIKNIFLETLNGNPQHYEVSIFKNDGSVIILSVNTTPIFESGKVVGTVSFGQDITVIKKSEELQLENAYLAYTNKAKSEFLANMSHELRTPLNAIIGFSEILKQKIAGKLNEKQESFLDDVLMAGNHLLELINDILDLSKVEAGKVELIIENVSVPETINEVFILIKEKAVKQNVVIKKELDPKLDFIEADKLRFKQILFNLLNNAVKFSKPEGGIVTIISKKIEDAAQISISDTGIGIRDEDRRKLFNEFQQLDSGITRKYGGTGLGLAITKKLVELHEGKITIESKYGEGSTFKFLLPLKRREPGETE